MSTNERVQEEIEALEAILMDDISITYKENGSPELIKSTIFPSTADDTNKQYVCVTLEVQLPDEYPDCEPLVVLRNPRGLDDSNLDHIYRAIKDKCQEFKGQPVIYELIELIRENLTESNLPTCHCAVCLYGFMEGDTFTKTQCFHYFHSYCLARHLITTEKLYNEEQEKLPAWQKSSSGFQASCPVCREPITCDVQELKNALPPRELDKAQNFQVTKELQMLQEKMKELFVYQKSRGGIIDIEAEENKLLLITESSDESPSDIRISPVDSLLSKRLINKGDKNCSREALQFNNISRNSCDLDMFIDESSELLSRTLKRKFTELDEIAERLKSRLSKVISADDESCSADCSKDDELSDQFERDINTSCDEDDFDTADFGEASSSHMNWQKEDAFLQQQVDPKLGQAGREVRSIDELLGQLGFDFSRGVSNNSNSKIDSRGAPLSDENKKS